MFAFGTRTATCLCSYGTCAGACCSCVAFLLPARARRATDLVSSAVSVCVPAMNRAEGPMNKHGGRAAKHSPGTDVSPFLLTTGWPLRT